MAEEIKRIELDKLNSKEVLKQTAEELTLLYNNAVQSGDFNTAHIYDEDIAQCVNKYTSLARSECFADCLKCSDPMLEAVKRLTFKSIKPKDAKVGEDKVPVREIIEVDKNIDLMKLHKESKVGIGKNTNWHIMIEKLNLLMVARVSKAIGINTAQVKANLEKYAISDSGRAYEFGENITSNTQLLKVLGVIVEAMIGKEYKPTSHDVAFLVEVYSKKGKQALTVATSNHAYFRQIIAEICHRIVLSKEYGVIFKESKK
jgi:hypothetical protein